MRFGHCSDDFGGVEEERSRGHGVRRAPSHVRITRSLCVPFSLVPSRWHWRCRSGTLRPSRRQIRWTRFRLTSIPERRSSAAAMRQPARGCPAERRFRSAARALFLSGWSGWWRCVLRALGDYLAGPAPGHLEDGPKARDGVAVARAGLNTFIRLRLTLRATLPRSMSPCGRFPPTGSLSIALSKNRSATSF